jgi:predicted SAM-dependent methyltransferase
MGYKMQKRKNSSLSLPKFWVKSFSIALNESLLEFRKVGWKYSRSKKISNYLNTHKLKKLQLGSRLCILNGWLNTDFYPMTKNIVFLDVTEPFPFKDNTFDYILNSHLIEHITFNDGQFMINECHRVLKPGGKLRIGTPDLDVIIELFIQKKSEDQQDFMKLMIKKINQDIDHSQETFVINKVFCGDEHKFIYNYHTLKNAMEDAGFKNITRHKFGESNDENLVGAESYEFNINKEYQRSDDWHKRRKFITLVLEGIC